MNRPRSLTAAAVIHFILSAAGIVFSLPMLSRGAEALAEAGDTPPYFIVVLSLVFGVIGVVSSYGVWRMQQWGVILAILVRIVDSLAALPGVLFAPTAVLKAFSGSGVVLSIVVIVLLLRREPRTSEPVGTA